MGNADISGSIQGCYSFLKNLPQTHTKLRLLYKRQYAYSQFGRIALNTISNFRIDSDFNPHQAQSVRKSMIDSSHYQSNTLNQHQFLQEWVMNNNQHQKQQQLPSSLSSFSFQQKERYLKKLIKQSYILVDLSDMLQGRQRNAYQKQIKQQIFQNQPNLLQSMIVNKKDLQQLIKNFHPVVIGLLQEYVKFCDDTINQFLENQECFYFKLLLNIKAHIIQKYKYNPQVLSLNNSRKSQMLIQDINTACKLLVDTVYIQHQMINKITRQIPKKKKEKIKQDDQQYNPENKQNNSVCFYEQINIHTLMMSIIFSDASFFNSIVQLFMANYSVQIKKFKQSPTAKGNLLIETLKNLKNKEQSKTLSSTSNINLFSNGNSIEKLFQSERNDYSSQSLFKKSVKMFNALHQKSQPIFRLKIIFELNKTLQKQFRQLFREYNINSSEIINFNRQSMSIIAKWLIHREKDTANACQNLIIILMTYWFIHDRYRESEKGSCLTPFVEQCQRILLK